MLKSKNSIAKKYGILFGICFTLAGTTLPMTVNAASSDQSKANTAYSIDTENGVELLNAVASGTTKGGCTWTIDQNYGLTIKGGKGTILYGYDNQKWNSYKDKITSITIDVPTAKDMSEMFGGYYNVKTIKAKISDVQGSLSRAFSCAREVAVFHKDINYTEYVPESALVSADISGMNVSNATNLFGLFYDCVSLTSVNFDNWNTSKVTNMGFLLHQCKSLKTANVSKWNTSNVTTLEAAFQHCESLEKLDVSKWDTSNVKNTGFTFSCCEHLKSLDLTKWNTSNVVDMSHMFQGCQSLTNLNLSSFKTDKVTDMEAMFNQCRSLQNLNIQNFNTKNVTRMTMMFTECQSLKSLDVSHFNTSNVTSMAMMFLRNEKLTSLNLCSFDTSNVKDIHQMFWGCNKLKELDLKSFNLRNVTSNGVYQVIYKCESLEKINAPKNLAQDISLDTNNTSGRQWYRDDNNTLTTSLPKNMKVSVSIHLQEKGNKIVDVRTTGWEYKYVTSAISKGLMNGVGQTKDKAKLTIFHGNDALTRAQFVQVLYNRDKAKPNSKLKNPFKDVKKTDWFYNAVLWAKNKKLVNGVKTNVFGVNDSIRRMDLVTILYNYAKSKGEKYVAITKNYNIKGYVDYKKVEKYAVTPMTWATNHKIMNGKPISGTKKYNLDPTGKASRAECATILINFENYMSSVK